MFNMFANMFWIAEGFGYVGVRLNFGLPNSLVGYLALSNKKLISVDKSFKLTFCLRAHFVLKFFEETNLIFVVVVVV